VDLLAGETRRESVAVLYESEVPVARALAVARELRAGGRSVSPVARRGKFGAQLGRLTEWGFTSFVHLRADTWHHCLAFVEGGSGVIASAIGNF